MASSVKTNLGLAVRMLLKPLIKLLVSQGITHAEFSEAAKEVYVEMALRHFVGEKTNKSKIAILTGLTRKEVANVITRAVNAESPSREFSRPSRVLSGWHTDPAYTGPYGVPVDIPYDSEEKSGEPPSFVHLVKTYSGDMSPKSMLDELVRGGSVLVQENKTLKVLSKNFEPEGLSPKLIERFGDVGFNFLSTVARNVEKEHTGAGGGCFDRVVFSDTKLTREELARFDEYLRSYLQVVLETIDNWLTANVSPKGGREIGEETFDTGVAMVQYIEWQPSDKTSLHDLLLDQYLDGETDEHLNDLDEVQKSTARKSTTNH